MSTPSSTRSGSGTRTAAAAVLRLVPVPQSEPPYDDELDEATRYGGAHREGLHLIDPGRCSTVGVQGTLALSFSLPSGLPVEPDAAAAGGDLRLVRGGSTGNAVPGAISRPDLPDATAWAARLVQAVVEVAAGDRPLAQLVRWTNAEVHAQLGRRVSASARLGIGVRSGAVRDVVRSVHVSEPSDGVAEVCALVQRGQRARAVALRMEGTDGRWRCTALALG